MKEQKTYNLEKRETRYYFSMKERSADGLYRCMVLPCPFTEKKYNEKTGQTETVVLTRKQVEKYCLKHAMAKGWIK